MTSQDGAGPRTLGLFEAFGVELEYMIVDAQTLDVKPIADKLLAEVANEQTPPGEVERSNGTSWSNELVNHVIEIKTTEPARELLQANTRLRAGVSEINALLKHHGARLMPGAMHPWMNPATETRLWAHEFSEVYNTFDKLFDCKRHGWANLQSVHLNLPFDGDDDFARLHAAVRLLLPLLPALCASSPVMDGVLTGVMDNRLSVYAANQSKTPSLTGLVIPEPVFTRADYEREILGPIERDVRALDPSGVMQPAWMNSRGAIARFDRGSIEIRVMDMQEHPAADVAICAGIARVLRWLVDEGPSDHEHQMLPDAQQLRATLDKTIRDADQAMIDDEELLELLAIDFDEGGRPAWEVWAELFDLAEVDLDHDLYAPLRTILDHGPLARRIAKALGHESPAAPTKIDPAALRRVYVQLCGCLASGAAFEPA